MCAFKIQDYNPSDYDFLDLGCGDGGSLDHLSRRFQCKGIGLDSDEQKIQKTRAKGFAAIQGSIDLFKNQPVSFRFCSMFDFLEHLPNRKVVREHLAFAAGVAREFLLIRHPGFEQMAYLKTLGLRQFWTRWSGHKATLTLDEMLQTIEEVGLRTYHVRLEEMVTASADPCIVPYDGPIDRHHYDETVYPPKPSVQLAEPVWGHSWITIQTASIPDARWRELIGL